MKVGFHLRKQVYAERVKFEATEDSFCPAAYDMQGFEIRQQVAPEICPHPKGIKTLQVY